jgi:hypothetical protein
MSKLVLAELKQKQRSNREHSIPQYLTVPDWPNYFNWPPNGGLRHIIFHAETNGFAPAIKRVGRRVLIDPEKFWQIVEEQNKEGAI